MDCLRLTSVTMSYPDRTWPYCCPCFTPVASLMAPGLPANTNPIASCCSASGAVPPGGDRRSAPGGGCVAGGRPFDLRPAPPPLAGGSPWHWAVSGFPVPWSAANPRAGPTRLRAHEEVPGPGRRDCAVAGKSPGRPRARARARGQIHVGGPVAGPRRPACGVPLWNRPKTNVREQGASKPPRHNRRR